MATGSIHSPRACPGQLHFSPLFLLMLAVKYLPRTYALPALRHFNEQRVRFAVPGLANVFNPHCRTGASCSQGTWRHPSMGCGSSRGSIVPLDTGPSGNGAARGSRRPTGGRQPGSGQSRGPSRAGASRRPSEAPAIEGREPPQEDLPKELPELRELVRAGKSSDNTDVDLKTFNTALLMSSYSLINRGYC